MYRGNTASVDLPGVAILFAKTNAIYILSFQYAKIRIFLTYKMFMASIWLLLPLLGAESQVPRRPGKVRGSHMPAEFVLPIIISNIENPPSSWSDPHHACTWPGVLCDDLAQLIAINWSGRQLRGNIRWDGLPFSLLRLDLGKDKYHSNFLKGDFQLCTVPSLVTNLDVNENLYRHTLDMTSLPGAAQSFSFQKNRFRGHVDLTSLPTGLLELNLSQNMFSGNLNFEHIPCGMRTLRLGRNRFEGIVDFSQLPKGMVLLDLDENYCVLLSDKVPNFVHVGLQVEL